MCYFLSQFDIFLCRRARTSSLPALHFCHALVDLLCLNSPSVYLAFRTAFWIPTLLLLLVYRLLQAKLLTPTALPSSTNQNRNYFIIEGIRYDLPSVNLRCLFPVTSFMYPEVASKRMCSTVLPESERRLTSLDFLRSAFWPHHSPNQKKQQGLHRPNLQQTE